MRTMFHGKKISGILTILPEHETSFEDTILAENITRVRRLKQIMGFDKRRRVKQETCISDFHEYGLKYLINQGLLKKEDIGAIVVVTLTPDYFAPSVSNILQGSLGLGEDVVCVDIAQGCAGYIVGLFEAFSILNHLDERKKVILCTGDIFNRETGKNIKSTEPEFGGDAASISIIENDSAASDIYFNFYTDGKSGKELIMPAGAFKYPVYSEEDANIELEDGRSGYGLGIWMDGSNVFNFIMREVPPMLDDIFDYSGKKKEEIEYYFFHQPNRYILEKLADKLEVSREKMPMDIVEKYGNSNSSTIPMAIVNGAAGPMREKKCKCCLSGFGSGLTWATILMELGEMEFCKQIISTC